MHQKWELSQKKKKIKPIILGNDNQISKDIYFHFLYVLKCSE